MPIIQGQEREHELLFPALTGNEVNGVVSFAFGNEAEDALTGPKETGTRGEAGPKQRHIDDPVHVPELRFPEFYTGLSPNNLYL